MTQRTSGENAINKESINRYLLGNMAEIERSRIEEQFFADDELFSQMLAAEDELIDDYVRGDLSARERQGFEQRYSNSPGFQQRVAFSQALAQTFTPSLDAAREPLLFTESRGDVKNSWWQSVVALFDLRSPTLGYGLAAAMLLLIVGGAALMLRQRGDVSPIVAKRTEPLDTPPLTGNGQPDPATTAENNQPPHNKTGQPSPQIAGPQIQTGARGSSANRQNPAPRAPVTPKPDSPHSVFATFVLTPGLVRSSASVPAVNQLVIASGITQIQLELEVEADDAYKTHRATVHTFGGAEVLRRYNLTAKRSPSGDKFRLVIPTQALKEGNYTLSLEGTNQANEIEEVEKFAFSVTKKQ